MKVSGFTIVRNAIQYHYPIIESISSILPICDEFIVNVGNSDDETFDLVQSINDSKIRIIENVWDISCKSTILSYQTNLALDQCCGDWAFYLQSDEVIHEDDLGKLKALMERHLDNAEVDALRFQWLHFYGSYYRYRVDGGWYQKQDRIIRNNGTIESCGDAYGFARKDTQDLRRENVGCFVYHYGWVQAEEIMAQRRLNAEQIGFVSLGDNERQQAYTFGNLNRFPAYFGTHPKVMKQKVADHAPSQEDKKNIERKYWWFPPRWFKTRYKTGKRVKEKII